MEKATTGRLPLIMISASGGSARMHEGILSRMQMAEVSAALARYSAADGLFISVPTNPIRMELPKGFQTSEFLLEHGFIGWIVARKDLQERDRPGDRLLRPLRSWRPTPWIAASPGAPDGLVCPAPSASPFASKGG